MIKSFWLKHPEYPGYKVLVHRNLFQRLVYPRTYAIPSEVRTFELWRTANWNRGK